MSEVLGPIGKVVHGEVDTRKMSPAIIRGETLGRSFSGDFGVVNKIIREAASSDVATRNQLIKGFSDGMAERVFPATKNYEDPVNQAQWEFAIGTWTVLHEAVDAVKTGVPYRRGLGIRSLRSLR